MNADPMTEKRLAELLTEGKFLTAKDLAAAQAKAKQENKELAEAVIELGLVSDAQIGGLVAQEFGVPFFDVSRERIEPSMLSLLPEKVAMGQQAICHKMSEKGIWFATSRPDNYEFFKLVEKRFHLPVNISYATEEGIEEALKGYKQDLLIQLKELLERMKKTQHDEDTVQLVQLLVYSAYDSRASDIHIEPEEKDAVVRYRIDGSMQEMIRYPIAFHEKVVFRIKILSRLRTDEHAQAQDGRFEVKSEGASVNLRVSILPITHGENVVMRLLSERFQRLRLEDMGFQADDLEKIMRACEMPHGFVLAVGPTGSGKTTTLYAMINILNKPDVNLMTIEDPVEYNIRGIRQIQVNPRTNLTFDQGLRSIVRQDPDIIMVGEIRDPETADIAVNAALTGHLMLSSLHANDAASTFPRLYEMNMEPFLLASSINTIIAQRLVRKICTHCIETYFLTKEEQDALARDPKMLEAVKKRAKGKPLSKIQLSHGRGCRACQHMGYMGRLGIYEIMLISDEIRPLIVRKGSSDDIYEVAVKQGMRTMLEDGMDKVFQGVTTLGEIIRAIKS
ncbi:MAG: GspE/PulE family protein [Patescibacteria group bacterium]